MGDEAQSPNLLVHRKQNATLSNPSLVLFSSSTPPSKKEMGLFTALHFLYKEILTLLISPLRAEG